MPTATTHIAIGALAGWKRMLVKIYWTCQAEISTEIDLVSRGQKIAWRELENRSPLENVKKVLIYTDNLL